MSIEQLVLECRRASDVVFSIGIAKEADAEHGIQGQEEPEEAYIVMDEN